MTGPAHIPTILVCHDCDLLLERPTLGHGETAACSRCGCVLARGARDVVVRTFAYALASLMLLAVANTFPFMEFQIAGRTQVARLVTGAGQLFQDGYWELAGMVLVTSLVAPLALLIGLLVITASMLAGRRPRWMIRIAKLITRLGKWSMMEVFLLGIIVAAIKLAQMAELVLGPALFAFVGLILTSTAAVAAYDPATVWDYLGGEEAT